MPELKTPKRTPKPRQPKAARLLGYILGYVEEHQIDTEKSITVLVDDLKESIVNEALADAHN